MKPHRASLPMARSIGQRGVPLIAFDVLRFCHILYATEAVPMGIAALLSKGRCMSFSQDQRDFHMAAKSVSLCEIPIIDFAPFLTGSAEDRLAVSAAIATALHDIGFFYLVGHGVPEDLRSEIFDQSSIFFAQPDELRETVRATDDWNRGVISLLRDKEFGLRLFEVFKVQAGYPENLEIDPIRAFFGPNRWPEFQPQLEGAAMRYFDAVTALGRQLLRAMALGLDLPEDRFDGFFDKPISQLGLQYYQALPPTANAQARNIDPHTDECPITILAQGEVSGLEVRRKDGSWISAPVVPGAYVINVGDIMMWWSNGRYLSNAHRVRNVSGRDRYSVPFFFKPDASVLVEPLPELVKKDGTARYESVNVLQHFMRWLEQDYAPKEIAVN